MYFKKVILGIVCSFFISKIVLAQDNHSGHDQLETKSHKKNTEDKHDHAKHEDKDEHKDADKHDHAKHEDKDEHKYEDKHDHAKHEDKVDHKDEDKHDHAKHEDKDEHKDANKESHEGHDEEGGGKAIGKGKAILKVDKLKGFKLSKEAIKTLDIKLKTVDGDTFNVAKTTLVTSKSEKGIYRFRAGYFKFLSAKILKKTSNGYKIKVKGVDFGDQVVVNGLGLLRVTDVYSTDNSNYGHSH